MITATAAVTVAPPSTLGESPFVVTKRSDATDVTARGVPCSISLRTTSTTVEER